MFAIIHINTFLLSFVLAIIGLVGNSQAQLTSAITPDGTVATIVTQNENVHHISGGTRPGDGPNLLHSFGQFDVRAGDIANFLNETNLPTDNILSRVTGGDPSRIFGTIQTTDFGGANLFLMNPAGVLFGSMASLNVGGSFHVTTADLLRFENGQTFFADAALDASGNSILRVVPPEAFGFLGDPTTFGFTSDQPAPITIDHSVLQVPAGEALSVIGGDIRILGVLNQLDEQSSNGLIAPSGRITLASVGSSGDVMLDTAETASDLSLDSFESLGKITLNQNAEINADGESGGAVVIRGGRLMVDTSVISANTLRESTGAPRGTNIQIDEDVVVTNGAIRSETRPGSTGQGGNIEITTGSLRLTDGGQVSTTTNGAGQGGSISVTASDEVILTGTSPNDDFQSGLFAKAQGAGDAGNIVVTARNVTATDGGQVSTTTNGAGRGGSVTVTASDAVTLASSGSRSQLVSSFFSVVEEHHGSGIFASTGGSGHAGRITVNAVNVTTTAAARIESSTYGPGNAGTVQVTAADAVTLSGVNPPNSNWQSGIFARANDLRLEGGLIGNAGNIVITAKNVTVTDGAQVQALFGRADQQAEPGVQRAGNITVTAIDDVIVSGFENDARLFISSTIRANAIGSADAGDVVVKAKNVMVANGAKISASTAGTGTGGSVTVTATDAIFLSGRGSSKDGSRIQHSQIEARSVSSASGKAGDIVVTAKNVTVTDGAAISNETNGSGPGGKLIVTATDDITLSGVKPGTADFSSGLRSAIRAKSTGTGDAGDVVVTARNVTVTDGAEISSSTNGPGNGGNVNVAAGNSITLTGTSSGIETDVFPSGVFTSSEGLGDAGNVVVDAGRLTLTQGAQISSKTSGANISTGDTGLTATAQAKAGAIMITAGEDIQLRNGSLITSQSATEGNAGDILLFAGDSILLDDSNVSTEAALASGGNIKFTAPNMIQSTNSQITSSVQGGTQTAGGNISLDPQFIVLQNSQILAQAFQGQGGNITLIGDVVLGDRFSNIDASSALGISGSVNVQASIQQLSETIAPLPDAIVPVAALYAQRCTSKKGGQFSSFVLNGDNSIPPIPGDFLPSPLLFKKSVHAESVTPTMTAKRLGVEDIFRPTIHLTECTS